MAANDGHGGDTDRALEERLALLEAIIERQQREIDELRASAATASTGALNTLDALAAQPAVAGDADARTDRRSMLRQAGALVAGSVAGATAVAVGSASPAAAASATFDGNPAVTATAVGSLAKAIHATGQSQNALVTVFNTVQQLPGRGVDVSVTGPASIGVSVTALEADTVGVSSIAATAIEAMVPIAQAGTAVKATAANSDAKAIHATGRSKMEVTSAELARADALQLLAAGDGGTALKATAEGPSSTGILVEGGLFGVFATGSTGVEAHGTTFGLRVAGDIAPIAIVPGANAVGAPFGFHGVGELYVDAGSVLWVCVESGTPGTWREIAGPKTAGAFHVLPATQRIYDSRTGFAPAPSSTLIKGKFGDGEERVIASNLEQEIANVPGGATAVVVNLTATDTNVGGFFAAFRNGIAWPGNASINWAAAATTIGNSAVIATDGLGRFKVRCAAPAGGGREAGAHLIVDLVGYYR